MRRPVLTIACSLCLACFLVVSLPVPVARANAAQFWAYAEKLGEDLNSFWNRELNDAANGVLDEKDALRGIELGAPDPERRVLEACEMIPRADPAGRAVRFQRRELIGLSFNIGFPLLAYLVGSEVMATPEDLDRYVREVAQPYFKKLLAACRDSGALQVTYQWEDLRPVSMYWGVDPRIVQRDVSEVALKSGQLRGDRNLHHFVAAYPIAFVLLHEAGHIVLPEDGLSSRQAEVQADRFAVDVFHGSRVSATFGIPFLQMFGLKGSETAMNCRIHKVAAVDDADLGLLNEMTPEEVARLEALRRYYETTYRDSCD